MNKKPLLSICIPTYNREKYLKRLLDSIVIQKDFNDTDDVEIVIDDGPSKDSTKEMVEMYQKKYPDKIRYYRNSQAIGMCPAFLEAISFSNGKYTWLFGSDDMMSNNSLEIVLGIIQSNNPKIILFNRENIIKNNEKIENNEKGPINILNFNGFNDFSIYLGFKDQERYTDKVNYFTFISIFCFKTEYYKLAYEHLIKDVKYSQYSLNMNYFNFSLIGFAKLYAKDLICIIESPRLVLCETYNHGRELNKKISSDLKILINYIKTNYIISINCKKMFNKILFSWWISCNILPPIKKILTQLGIYKNLVDIYTKKIQRK